MFPLAGLALATGAWLQGVDARGPSEVVISLERCSADSDISYALMLATRMFADVGIHIVWSSSDKRADAQIHISIVDWQANVAPDQLANVKPFASHPKPVVILWKHVRAAATSLPGLAPRLLAHVMVHEVTHVLQGSNAHSATGIMKARWTPEDCLEMLHGALKFASYDVIALKGGMDRREQIARERRNRD
jgi:hypothetical protein